MSDYDSVAICKVILWTQDTVHTRDTCHSPESENQRAKHFTSDRFEAVSTVGLDATRKRVQLLKISTHHDMRREIKIK